VYNKIMIPVDLEHAKTLEKGLQTGADLARHYGAEVCFVAVTTETPSAVAHTPAEFARKLEAFAQEQASSRGLPKASSRAYAGHDPTIDLENTLFKAIEESGADLVVMASHVPGMLEHVWSSHAGRIASHAEVSVFVVR
jgi:nucleotide-binding universal stress UspA family protein